MSKIDGKKITKHDRLYDIKEWEVEDLIFADPEQRTVPNTNPPINYYSIDLLTRHYKIDVNGNIIREEGKPVKDGTIGDLNLRFDKVFSFGVSEVLSNETKAVQGHTMSFAMWSRDGATEAEVEITNKIEEVIAKCKDHIVEVRKQLGKSNAKLEISDLKKMDNLLYWKTDDEGERIAGQGPTFSPKLVETKDRVGKDGKLIPATIKTRFYHSEEIDEETGEERILDPLDYLKKLCYVEPAVKFASIFIGATAKCIQCKLTEAFISPLETKPHRLLFRHKMVPSERIQNIDRMMEDVCITKDPEEYTEGGIEKESEFTKEIEATREEEATVERPKKKITKKKTVE